MLILIMLKIKILIHLKMAFKSVKYHLTLWSIAIRVSHFLKLFEFHLPNPGSHSILYLKEESKFSEFSDFVYYSEISQQNGSDPFISEKKIVQIIGFKTDFCVGTVSPSWSI